MSGGKDKVERGNAERISALGESLKNHGDDKAMLENVHAAIQTLLAESADSEAGIRAELQARFEAGQIRAESFELVQKMLDRMAHGNTARIDDAAEHVQTARLDPATPLQQTVRIDRPSAAATPTVDTVFSDNDFINTDVIQDQQPPKPLVEKQLQVGEVLRDRFLLQEKMPGGSMGVVFKALDRRMAEAREENPYVAIKVLNAKLARSGTALRALQQEASKGRFLSHPNIVRFIDLDRDGTLHFIVMEWLEGRTIADILDNGATQKLDVAAALNIVGQIGRALEYAHLRGVVHADVKPGNIIITPDGHAKLFDFGVARILQNRDDKDSRFDPGILGAKSKAYSSMQVLTGEDPVPTDDVFSLGCLLYRLVAGIRVFGPRNAADAAAEGMEPQRPNGLSDAQWKALKKALSYSRVTRFKSPKEFTDALNVNFIESAIQTENQTTMQAVNQATEVPAASPGGTESPAVVRPKATVKPVTPVRVTADTEASRDVVITATRDRDPDDTYVLDEDEDDSRRSRWRLAIIGLLFLATIAVVTQTDVARYVEEYADSDLVKSITGQTPSNDAVPVDEPPAALAADEDGIVDAPPSDIALQPDIVGTNDEPAEEIQVDQSGADAGAEARVDSDERPPDIGSRSAESVPEAVPELAPEPPPAVPDFDYTGWPVATTTLALRQNGAAPSTASLAVREDSGPAVIELTRFGAAANASRIHIREIVRNGSQSQQSAGQYALTNNGEVNFERGQERVQLELSTPSDSNREADRNVTLQVSDAANPVVSLGTLNVTLEDDDQRDFELSLLPNTVSFRVSELSVNEADPAVQVDVIRYRPDDSSLDIEYVLRDVTASEGQDYFAPGFNFISFGAGQRTARLLIPLGQDALIETDETFVIEVVTTNGPVADINKRVAVMIRDDDR